MENEIERALSEVSNKSEGNVKSAVDWFKDKLQALISGSKDRNADRAAREFPKQMNQTFLTKKMNPRSVGRMFMFAYDAKWKNKLPYWDALPLILLVDYEADGFTGLNLHYVPPLVRKKIIQALQGNLNTDPIVSDHLSRNEKSKIELNYRLLKNSTRFDILKPCFKKYLFSHVRSNFLYVDPSEWEKAVMLPTERFQKASKQKVFKDSMSTSGNPQNNKPRPSVGPKVEENIHPTSNKTTSFFDRK